MPGEAGPCCFVLFCVTTETGLSVAKAVPELIQPRIAMDSWLSEAGITLARIRSYSHA